MVGKRGGKVMYLCRHLLDGKCCNIPWYSSSISYIKWLASGSVLLLLLYRMLLVISCSIWLQALE